MRLPLSCLAALLLAGTLTSSASAQITVDRQMISLNPTSERAANLSVRNRGSSYAQVSVQFEDWDVDAQGTSHWRKTGAVAGSCGDRVSIWPRLLTLAPGEQQIVRVSVNTNAPFDSECWSAAVLRSANIRPSKSRSDSAAWLRTVVSLYVTPSGLNVDGELSDMYVQHDSLEVIFRNTGKLRTNIVGEIQIQTLGDSVVTTVPLDSAVVLAGATRRYRVAMPKLSRGQYLLMALVDFGGENLTAVQAALEMR